MKKTVLKNILFLFVFLPVTLSAQTPDTQAQERLEETQEVERIDPLDGAVREFEEAQQQQQPTPVEVRCECVCPQSENNPPVSGNVRRETPMDQQREEALEEEQVEQRTMTPPGQNNSQFVDPIEQQMKRNQ